MFTSILTNIKKLTRELSDNPSAQAAVLFAASIIIIYLQRQYILETFIPNINEIILTYIGYGFATFSIFFIILMTVVIRFKKDSLQFKSQLLSTLLTVISIQLLMGAFKGPQGIVFKETTGGKLGKYLWEDFYIPGPVLLLLLIASAFYISWPKFSLDKLKLSKQYLLSLLYFLKKIFKSKNKKPRIVEKRTYQETKENTKPTIEEHRKNSNQSNYQPIKNKPFIEQKINKTEEKIDTQKKPKRAFIFGKPWAIPEMSLLEYGPEASISSDESTLVAEKIEETLLNHGIEVRVNQIKPGPTVTMYGLTPGWTRKTRKAKKNDDQDNNQEEETDRGTRVKVDSIVAREKDLALALAAPSLRIEAPVPGESIVGIEVPNKKALMVSLRKTLEHEKVNNIKSELGIPLALGQGSSGEATITDLRKLPHLLIAGSTGSGKSVCINTLLVSMIAKMTPDKLRLLLIDPKRVELTPFNGIPHLISPVVVEPDEAVKSLKGLLEEMIRRYKILEEIGVRNIDSYINHPKAFEPMPYLVIAIDELADLMMTAPYEVEQTLTRLAQLGRATGIHLIVATQRPSVDVVTGLIKANFPSRISFAVVSQVDSRTILDSSGAERLLGKGDMLFLSSDFPKAQRVQGAYLSDQEINKLVNYWSSQEGPPLPEISLELPINDITNPDFDSGDFPKDELFSKASELAGRYSHISTSLLQRKLRIGYPRAARLIDQLEDAGVIGPEEPGKSREVLIQS
ncbi:MAG: cell division protein FtsK [Chloroflexi bacterium]|nr:cell division protein FtsK [Chloroflexota bacterium]|tara:strand:- start:6131 stop:8353 length:2223 start_codon:yes stop_codon:yes gene_type:complete